MKKTFIKSAAIALALSAFSLTHAEAEHFHLIKKGDTLWSLSQRYGMTVEQLKESNELTSNIIYAGKQLEIQKIIKVKKGDTLWSIAKKHGTTVHQLKHVNGLKSDTIFSGQKLEVPTVILIRSGDTLWSISQKYGISVEELRRNNGLKNNLIFAGQLLKVNQMQTYPAAYDAEKVRLHVPLHSGFIFTPEEPRTYILQFNNDDNYFARVEVLDSQTDIKNVRMNAEDQLASLGAVTELRTQNSLPFYENAHFFLHSQNTKVQTAIGVKSVDGKILKFTIHYPNEEESEAVYPAMLKILQEITIK
ncbi:LysM peptidoglycan-binding domain-containing protein [Rossellomorea vietnamensis]|uniref:LysM peptidoglycan-binding domain-containing protein n=2 Tax=Rossellomorea TaxID=2837508 RepID=A0A5D4KCJ7_9BACI|nr:MULTISPECIES: LysM peptidoglycan-binding domain-containing protein [Rossellomorea]TYR75071.1 LysM peptidoglycan-binding domain-containing protein [Rossellomorea vietnamensis]TYS79827.1 LysM peptidoglycan-binding domain-containing protein [Rossellomorea aquimaris]